MNPRSLRVAATLVFLVALLPARQVVYGGPPAVVSPRGLSPDSREGPAAPVGSGRPSLSAERFVPAAALRFEEVYAYDLGEFWCENNVAVADYDRDGRRDIAMIVTTSDPNDPGAPVRSKVVMLHNEGNWQFSDTTLQQYGDHRYGYGIDTADMNQDGWSDLVVREGELTHVYLNDQTGGFTDVWQGGAAYGSLALHDLDGDGFPDLLLGGRTPDGSVLRAYENDGSGTDFAERWESEPYGSSRGMISEVLAANLDGDGVPDVVATEFYDGLVMTFVGSRSEISYTEKTMMGLSDRVFGLSVGNVDGDAWDDVAVGVGWGRVYVFTSQGDGTLAASWTSQDFRESAAHLTLADFNLDGYDDLFVGTFGDGVLRIYENQPDGFDLVWHGRVVRQGYTGTVVDVDQDGRLDLIVGEENAIRILHQRELLRIFAPLILK